MQLYYPITILFFLKYQRANPIILRPNQAIAKSHAIFLPQDPQMKLECLIIKMMLHSCLWEILNQTDSIGFTNRITRLLICWLCQFWCLKLKWGWNQDGFTKATEIIKKNHENTTTTTTTTVTATNKNNSNNNNGNNKHISWWKF